VDRLVNNWASGPDEKGQPKRNPRKDATIAGWLVNSDVTNDPPPTFSPLTGRASTPPETGVNSC